MLECYREDLNCYANDRGGQTYSQQLVVTESMPDGTTAVIDLSQLGTSPSASAGTTVRVVEVSPASPLRMGNPISVSGRGLDPRRDANAGVLQGGVVHPISGSLPVQPDGSFAVDGNVPTDLSPGPAALIACNFDAQHRTDLGQCIQLNVSVVR